jgi:hypothetical protein
MMALLVNANKHQSLSRNSVHEILAFDLDGMYSECDSAEERQKQRKRPEQLWTQSANAHCFTVKAIDSPKPWQAIDLAGKSELERQTVIGRIEGAGSLYSRVPKSTS